MLVLRREVALPRSLLSMVVALALSACAQQPQMAKLDIPYVPQRDAVAIKGAGDVTVRVIAREGRDNLRTFGRTRVGVTYASSNDIPASTAAALSHELTAQGFRVLAGRVEDKCQSECMTVFVTVMRFQSEFLAEFASPSETRGLVGPAIAAVALDVEVADRDGIVIYAARGEGGAVERDILTASATSTSSIQSSARNALVGAFTNAIADIVTDVRLRQALLTGKVPQKRDELLDARLTERAAG